MKKSMAAVWLVAWAPCIVFSQPDGNSKEVLDSGGSSAGNGCPISGQLFDISPLGGQMLVKSPSGDIDTLLFDQTTVFARLSPDAGPAMAPDPITPMESNAGDWICAWANRDATSDRASEVLVVSRKEIEKQQQRALVHWRQSGAFGTVVKLDSAAETFVLDCEVPGGEKCNLLVDVNQPAEFRRYPPDAAYLSERKPASWSEVHVGDRVFVRGARAANGSSIRARMILIGDFQAMAATIDSIDALDEMVGLHELAGGQAIRAHIKPSTLFMIDPAFDTAGPRLLTLDFADLKAGDAVVVIGRLKDSSGVMNGLALIADFGRFDAPSQNSGHVVAWTLRPMNLDVP